MELAILENISNNLMNINKRLNEIEIEHRIFYQCLLRTQNPQIADEFCYRLDMIEDYAKSKKEDSNAYSD